MPSEIRAEITLRVPLPDRLWDRAEVITRLKGALDQFSEDITGTAFGGWLMIEADEVTPKPRRPKDEPTPDTQEGQQ